VAILATVAPPLIFILVLLVSAASVGRNPVALVVLDDGPAAQQLTRTLETSEAFKVVRAQPQPADRMLQNLEVSAVITIPAGFSDRFASGQPDPVSIRINNLNLDFTNDLRRSLPAAVTRFYKEQAQSPILVGVSETDLRAQDVGLVQFELIPALVLLLTVAGVVNCGLATAREFEDRTIKELMLAPVGPAGLIAGKLLAGWVTTVFVASVVLILGALTGLLRPSGWYWLETIGLVMLIALMTAGLGAALGARVRAFAPVTGLGINASIWLFFLSGGIAVPAFLPGWVQALAAFTPTFYGVHALEMAIFYASTDLLGRDLLVLAATATAALFLGALSLRRSVVA
jgi:ABC-2 type transport system permease protein